MRGQSVKYLQKKDVKRIIRYLEKKNKVVILGIVKFSLNTGLRISDVLKLKFEDLESEFLKEKKTKKIKKIFFNNECRVSLEKLKQYYLKKGFKNYNTGYLFKSFKKNNKPISYQGVNFYIKKLKEELNINYPFNTHSFRKTWARTVYNKYDKDIGLVMKLLNHSNPTITLRYIGIEEDVISKVYDDVSF